jgi:general secretion pathway protein D
MKNMKHFTLCLINILMLSACANQPAKPIKVDDSYLKSKKITTVENAELLNNTNDNSIVKPKKDFRFVPTLKLQTKQAVSTKDVLSQFSDNKSLTITVDELPLADYLHQILGTELSINYILSDDIKSDKSPVTLNLQDKISERKLFTLTEELLSQRDYVIRFDDDIFYIHKDTAKGSKGNVVYGYGNRLEDVPQTSTEIIQMIPFQYGIQTALPNTLKQLLGVRALLDQKRNSITIQGKRKDIIKALEFIKIMDSPRVHNRQIGIYQSAFLSTTELKGKLSELLGQEGITVGGGKSNNQAITIVELDKQGELIFFSSSTDIIERAVFWAKKIDQPILTTEKQYFIYQPNYSRAVDMGESLQALIGNGASIGNSTSAENQNEGKRPSVSSASSKDMKLVVDERSNSLIFFTSGESYKQLYPLIKRLDVLPKQVLLEVIIAEVKLTDAFKSGVKFNLTNQGAANITGGFDLASGNSGLSYVLSGAQGSLSVNLLQTNNNVNVLSRPTLLVRDGVNATITVGDDIPTVGQIITDPVNGSQTSVVYRKTGVELSVMPTINARGVVIMEISQSISNQSPGDDSVAGSPIIFERSIKTEVIAESGQTIVLGGLISDNHTINDTSVPFFSSIPFFGKLFDTTSDTKDKTELVVLVTPKIIESSDEWDAIKAKFSSTLSEFTIE